MTNTRKRSSLSEAFGDVAARRERTSITEPEKQRDIQQSQREQVEMVPVKGVRLVAANTPMNRTFTVTAKERYEWSLELKRRGLSAVSVLRKAMNELLEEGKA